MLKFYLSLICMLLVFGSTEAQNYTEVSSFGNTYVPLTNPVLISNSWDQNLFLQGNIGVTYNWYNKSYPFDGQGNDGVLVFGAGTIAAGSPTDSSDFDFDGFFTALKSRANATSNPSTITYQVEGTQPNRIVKFQWNNAGLYGDTADFVNFQMWLYEASATFEVHYGPSLVKDPNVVFGSGLTGPPVGIFFASDKPKDNGKIYQALYLTGSPTSPKMNASADYNGLSAMPSNGTIYTFKYLGTSGIAVTKKIFSDLSLFPNPARSQASLNVSITENTALHIELQDISGRTLQTIYDGLAPVGNQTFDINTATCARGIYLVKITTDSGMETRKLAVE